MRISYQRIYKFNDLINLKKDDYILVIDAYNAHFSGNIYILQIDSRESRLTVYNQCLYSFLTNGYKLYKDNFKKPQFISSLLIGFHKKDFHQYNVYKIENSPFISHLFNNNPTIIKKLDFYFSENILI